MRTIHNNWGDGDSEPSRESFRKHLAEMNGFSRAHEKTPDKNRPIVIIAAGQKAAAAPENGVEKLLNIGYVLSMVRDRGTPLLPRNWQN